MLRNTKEVMKLGQPFNTLYVINPVTTNLEIREMNRTYSNKYVALNPDSVAGYYKYYSTLGQVLSKYVRTVSVQVADDMERKKIRTCYSLPNAIEFLQKQYLRSFKIKDIIFGWHYQTNVEAIIQTHIPESQLRARIAKILTTGKLD